jgi:hypothetical protein
MKEAKVRTLEDYLAALEDKKSEKPEQVKEGIEVYVSLWRKAIENGVVKPSEELGTALGKVEARGGLYRAAEESLVRDEGLA